MSKLVFYQKLVYYSCYQLIIIDNFCIASGTGTASGVTIVN